MEKQKLKPYTREWLEERYDRQQLDEDGQDVGSLYYHPIYRAKGYTREQCYILDCFVHATQTKGLDSDAPYDLLNSMKKTYLDFQGRYEPDWVDELNDPESFPLTSTRILNTTRIWSLEVAEILNGYFIRRNSAKSL